MDRIEAMSTLLEVVKAGSFSAASRSLGMPLATVSRRIAELETHLGAKLLVRTTRKLALTEAGSAYAASARRILAQIDETERAAAGEFTSPRGDLMLTAPILFGRLHVLPIVSDFLAAYPDINVRLTLSDRNLHLVDDHVDLAVRIGPLPDSRLVATRVGQIRNVVCASPKLLDTYGPPKAPADLAKWPCVTFDFRSTPGIWSFPSQGRNKSIDVATQPRLSVSTAEAAVDAAIRSVGVTRVLHYQCADAVRDDRLRIVLAKHEPAPWLVHLVHAGRGALPSKTRVFLDFAANRLRERLKSL